MLSRRAVWQGTVALLATPTAAFGKGGGEWRKRIAQIAQASVRAGATAGLSITVVHQGRTEFAQGFGYSNLETSSPANVDTVYRIASITKPFTATAVLMLRERGKLRLEDTLAKFYPKIPNADVVTVRHLLSHTSGLHDYARGGLPQWAEGWRNADEFANGVASMSPLYDFKTGSQFSYSNTGYILLGGIIEKVAGTSFGAFLDDNIFRPFGMTHTKVDDPMEIVLNRASGYVALPAERKFRHAGHMASLPFAAGAMRSTASDLARWSTAFFGGRVLPLRTVAEMATSARVDSGALVRDAMWFPPNVNPGSPPSFASEYGYGMGWELTRFYGRKTIGHSGGIAGFNSILTYYPDDDLTLIILSNTENGAVYPWRQLLALGQF